MDESVVTVRPDGLDDPGVDAVIPFDVVDHASGADGTSRQMAWVGPVTVATIMNRTEQRSAGRSDTHVRELLSFTSPG